MPAASFIITSKGNSFFAIADATGGFVKAQLHVQQYRPRASKARHKASASLRVATGISIVPFHQALSAPETPAGTLCRCLYPLL